MGRTRREKCDLGTKTERDGRDHVQPAADLAFCGIGRDLHRLVRNDQGLATDFKDLLDRKHGRIFRAADQRGIINPEHARGDVYKRQGMMAAQQHGPTVWNRCRLLSGNGMR